ncbi:putative 16S rRNA (Cytosine(967)-C(5))-methyltransferase [Balamuthia mandrillaris]
MEEEEALEGTTAAPVVLLPKPEELDPSFKAFLEQNHIPLEALQLQSLFRFFRLNPFPNRHLIPWKNSTTTACSSPSCSSSCSSSSSSSSSASAAATSTLDLVPHERLKEGEEEALLREMEQQVGGVQPEPVPWLRGFYRLPHHIKLVESQLYKQSKIYGIDASSGAAVVALGVAPGDNVLDLCCAPGAKLCMLADQLEGKGTVTGVDVSEHRLATCRSMLVKYAIPNVRLFLEDGTTFHVLAPPRENSSLPASSASSSPTTKKKEKENEKRTEEEEEEEENESAENERSDERNETEERRKERKRNRQGCILAKEVEITASRWRKRKRRRRRDPDELTNVFYAFPMPLSKASSSELLYDKILLDAQCTLDASVRHILQFQKLGWKDFSPHVGNETVELQKRLIRNSFQLLAPGGSLVYSTCSFSRDQNEGVVEWLLEQEPTARLVVIPEAAGMPCQSGMLQHTLRFYPAHTQTSGLFIAKLTKLKAQEMAGEK